MGDVTRMLNATAHQLPQPAEALSLLGLSERTAKRTRACARARLYEELKINP